VRQAEHLAEDLRYTVSDRNRDILRLADDFTIAARTLQRALATPEREEAQMVQWAQRHWDALQQRVQQLRGQDTAHAKDRAAALGEDFQRLVALIEQSN
jgi:hypothetical protein